MIKSFRNLFALFIGGIVFPGIWIGQGIGLFNLPGEIIGATIAIETLIAQFYWRKKPQGEQS